MKKLALITLFFIGLSAGRSYAQQIDSIYFHLYTDSLKRNIYNYINVDGKKSDGRYIPLDNKQVVFTSNGGKWDGNSIYFDSSFTAPSVTITVHLKERPETKKTVTLFFKTVNTDEALKSEQELLEQWKKQPPAKKKKGS